MRSAVSPNASARRERLLRHVEFKYLWSALRQSAQQATPTKRNLLGAIPVRRRISVEYDFAPHRLSSERRQARPSSSGPAPPSRRRAGPARARGRAEPTRPAAHGRSRSAWVGRNGLRLPCASAQRIRCENSQPDTGVAASAISYVPLCVGSTGSLKYPSARSPGLLTTGFIGSQRVNHRW